MKTPPALASLGRARIDPSQKLEPKMDLLNDDQLERSGVVANCRMNRERSLTGSNGYEKELGFNPLDLLKAKPKAHWLDLGCGSGTALVEAADLIDREGMNAEIAITGIDLVSPMPPFPQDKTNLYFIVASLANWEPDCTFDLITCVHGLHYLGDKLGLVARAVSWLENDGQFIANLDIDNIKVADGQTTSRTIATELRKAGLEYDVRKKLLRCTSRRELHFPFRYLGADDQAGPNYTKQPVVDSYYAWE